MVQTTTPTASRRTMTAPPGEQIPWRKAGLRMAVIFSILQMLNEIGTLMAIPLYGSMAASLQLTPGQTAWALMSTTLMGAATITILAKAGDVFGHRRLMFLSLVGITVGYIISALAPSFIILIIGRALVGIMAGQALCVGIMNDRLTPENRRKTVAVIAGGQAIGVFLGFAFGGALLAMGGDWRDAFWIGAVLTIISAIGFYFYGLDSDALHRRTQSQLKGITERLDIAGVSLMGVGLLLLCIGISQSTVWGIFSGLTVGTISAGLALLVLSLVWESRTKNPLLPVRDIFSRRLGPAYAIFVSLGIGGSMLFNLTMTLLQIPGDPIAFGFGMTALAASFVFLPMTFAGIVATRLAPKMLGRTPRGTIVIAGLGMFIAFMWLAFAHTNVWSMTLAIFLFGISYTTLLTASVSVIAIEAAHGKGAGTASVYVAIALSMTSIGTAIYSAIMSGFSTPEGMPAPDAFTVGYIVAGSAALVSVLCGVLIKHRKPITQVVSH
ncbi:MFS transporter [uncultured Corynebacterium sp.]|uniref:MFS transporter n=1 Tax=uncultured Corynebacterium sp. TaxID=159447 RepID=UPI0025D4ED52|nr:MFS transporter [uncultured Corynebacterium sp.]